MAKKYVFDLTEAEQTALQAIVSQRKGSAQRLVRAQCLLALARNGRGWTDVQTAQTYGVSTRSLERLRQRVCEAGVEGALRGQPRQQWPASKFTGEVEAHLVATACSTPPDGTARWTLTLLAERLVEARVIEAISPASVGRLLKKTRSSPGNGVCG